MKKRLAGILCVAILGLTCLAIFNTRLRMALGISKRVEQNILIQEVGIFDSPHNLQSLRVWSEADGTLKFFVRNQEFVGTGGGPSASFAANSNWFMCWDTSDRLWTYIPEQDGNYCRCWYSSGKNGGSTLVGEFGGWEGIPAAFFAKLPDNVKAIHTTFASNHSQ